MNWLNWRSWPLAAKLSLTTSLLILLAVATVTVLAIQREQETFRTEHERDAQLLLDAFEKTLANPLLQLDVFELRGYMENIGDTEADIAGRVYDREGRLVADSEQGSTFGSVPDPVGQRLIEAGSDIIYEWKSDHLLAGQSVIVGNQPIGAISITLPTDELAERQANMRRRSITIGFVTMAIGIVLSALFSRTITDPLSDLNEVSAEIAGGNLNKRAAIKSQDEVGRLAVSFNQMADQLQNNIRDLEQRNADLHEANERVVEASRLKSEFLATMSHELRTPLNAILGYSGILLMGIRGPMEDRAKDAIQRIENSGKHLLALINDLLDISKIEAGRMEIMSVPIEVKALVQTWRERIGVLADEKHIGFETAIDPHLPAKLLGDKERLTQIAQNLLSNAVKFTEEGTVSLEVVRDGEHWQIKVTDTGTGIPPNALEYIFDEFRQVDSSSTREQGGTGLGLAIVRKLARAMGGDVTVTSKLGQGSTFLVWLPLHAVEEQPVA